MPCAIARIWPDTVILFMYDEHGGFYDHVNPPRAQQLGGLNPDGIKPWTMRRSL